MVVPSFSQYLHARKMYLSFIRVSCWLCTSFEHVFFLDLILLSTLYDWLRFLRQEFVKSNLVKKLWNFRKTIGFYTNLHISVDLAMLLMCACVCAYMQVRIPVNVNVCTYVHKRAHRSWSIHTCMCSYAFVCICVYAYAWIDLFVGKTVETQKR